MPRNRALLTIVFYGVLALVVLGVLFEVFPAVLPDAIAQRIGHNSEGILLAVLLAAWIQFVRPSIAAGPFEAWVTAAVALGCLAMAAFLLATDFPSRFRTLNETFLTAAVLIPYLQLRRPWARRFAPWLSASVLAIIVVGGGTQVVTDQAETLGALLLAPIAFDVVDRAILDPEARTSPKPRFAWYLFLLSAPILLSVLQYVVGVQGVLYDVTRYGVRITEAFVCMLLVELFFAVGLGRTGRASTSELRLSSPSTSFR